MITARSITDGSSYLKRHLRANDYYAEGEKVEGEWFGKGAETLGLQGQVQAEDFEALRQNRHPKTGERLTSRNLAGYMVENPLTGAIEQRNPIRLHDITFSAPKSASVTAMIGGDEHIPEAFRESVKVALREMEHFAAIRVRKGQDHGSEKIHITGNVVGALFFHDTSRTLDPQLHAHAVLANASRAETGQWYALQRLAMMEASPYIRKVLYHDFAWRLRSLGYELEREGESFRIRGITPAMVQQYSLRTLQRLDFEQRYEATFGHAPSKRRIEHFIKEDQGAAENRFRGEYSRAFGYAPSVEEVRDFVRDWRDPKLREISTAEVRESQRARIAPNDLASLHEIVAEARQRANSHIIDRASSTRHAEAARMGLEHCLERLSVARLCDVLERAYHFGTKELGELEAHRLRSALKTRGEVLTDGQRVTTQQALEEEASVLRFTRQTRNAFASLGEIGDPKSLDRLSDEQRKVVETLSASRDGVAILIGDAGTGKTFTLQALHEAHRNQWQRDFVALAPTTKATEELRANGHPQASTVASFLVDKQRQEAAHDHAILVDEAGLLTSTQMAELIRVADERKARLILVGDTKQHESIERGSALRNLLDSGLAPHVRLQEVRRQREEEHKEMARLLAEGKPWAAFYRADKLGMVEEIPQANQLFVKSAKHYADSVQAGREILVVIPTWKEIDGFNEEARAELRRRGLIHGDDVRVRGSASLAWTAVERTHWDAYQPGHVLNFHRAVSGMEAGESLTVNRVLPDGIIGQKDDGREIRLTKKQRHAFDVAESKELTLAAGDTILFRANCPAIMVGSLGGVNLVVFQMSADDADENYVLMIVAAAKE